MTQGSGAESKDPDKVPSAMQHQGVRTRNLLLYCPAEEITNPCHTPSSPLNSPQHFSKKSFPWRTIHKATRFR